MGRRDVLFVAGGAVVLAGCTLVLGIDDVTVKPDGGTDAADAGIPNDATTNDVVTIDDVNVPFVDAEIFADGPVTDCVSCPNAGMLTECALTCDEPLPLGLTIDNGEQFAYFTNVGVDGGGSIFLVNLSGGVPTSLIQDAGNLKPSDIAYSSAHKLVFYGLNAGNAIARSDGGPNGASLWESVTGPTTLRSASGGSGGRIFVLSGTTLRECDVDTCAGTPPVFTGGSIIDFSIADSVSVIGWAESSTSSIYYGNLLGTTSTTLVSGQTGTRHVAINGGDPTTYAWSVDTSASTAEIRDNGTGAATSTTIFSGQSVGGMQFSDDGVLYFTDTIAGVVYERDASGVLSIFADKQDAPGEIAVGGNWVLWVARGINTRATGRVMRKHR